MEIISNTIFENKINNYKEEISFVEQRQKETIHIIISIIIFGFFALIRFFHLAILKGKLKRLESRIVEVPKQDEKTPLEKNDSKKIENPKGLAINKTPLSKNIDRDLPQKKLTDKQFVDNIMPKLLKGELAFSLDLMQKVAMIGVKNAEGCRLHISKYLTDPQYGNLLITELENMIKDKIFLNQPMDEYEELIEKLILIILHKDGDYLKEKLRNLFLECKIALPAHMNREFVDNIMPKLLKGELAFSLDLMQKLVMIGVKNAEGCRLHISKYLTDPKYWNLLIIQLENMINDKISLNEPMDEYVKLIDKLIFIIDKNGANQKEKFYNLLLQCTLSLPVEMIRADGINQYNFAKGEGRMGCGSFAVEALIRREKNLTMDIVDGVLPSGLCRHKKLNKPLNSYSSICSDICGPTNPEVCLNGSIIEESNINAPLQMRYEFILKKIPSGDSGILLVQKEFLMLRKLEDGKVEIFDSHGSKSAKSDQGAYFARFNSTQDATLWLCAHQIPSLTDVDINISFSPIKVKQRTDEQKAMMR